MTNACPIPMQQISPTEARFDLIKQMAAQASVSLFDIDDPVQPHEIAEKVVPTADLTLARMGLAQYDNLKRCVSQSDLERIYNSYPSDWRISRVMRIHPLAFYHPNKNRVDYLASELLKDANGFKQKKVAFSICGHENGNGTKDGDQIYLFVTLWFEPK